MACFCDSLIAHSSNCSKIYSRSVPLEEPKAATGGRSRCPSNNSSAGENPARQPSSIRKVIVASLIGTSLEWYDFFIYGTAAALVFNKLFFPSFEPLVGTLLAFATYAVGFVARPLGGVVFGHYGDKLGRKNVLVVTLLLMGIATFLIGVLPTHATIGVWAPILLVFLRFLQGLGLGGEWGGAVLMTLESGDSRRRGLNASWPQVGVPIGLLLANGVLSLMGTITSNEAFLSWGWRVPFLLSGLLVIVGLWIRMTIAESPLFSEVEAADSKAAAPIVEVLRRYPKQVLLAIGARIGVDVAFYTFVLFVTTYVATYLELPRQYALNAVLIAAAVQVIAIPYFGHLSDRFGRRPIYLIGAIGSAIWIFVFFALLDTQQFGLIVLAVVVALIFHAAMYGPQAVFHRRDVSDQGALHGRLYGLSVGRHPGRRAGTDHLGRIARPVRHLGRRLGIRRGDAARDDHLRVHRSRDIQDRSARRRCGVGPGMSPVRVDLNSDLGEGRRPWRRRGGAGQRHSKDQVPQGQSRQVLTSGDGRSGAGGRAGRTEAPGNEPCPRLDRDDHVEVVHHTLRERGVHGPRDYRRQPTGGIGARRELGGGGQRGEVGGGLSSMTGNDRRADIEAAGHDRQQHHDHRDGDQAGRAALTAPPAR